MFFHNAKAWFNNPKVKWIICKRCQREGAYPLSEKAVQLYMKGNKK